ncbi:MAG: sodium:solute symporter [Planctomycetota bacterium]
MSWLDWVVVALYLGAVFAIGFIKGRRARELDDYFLAKRSMRWWAVGLSVMATHASAITLIGGTGQGCAHGMGFIQMYLGLPLAMVILCATLVPFFHRARIYTAYEYLERRFGAQTRMLTSAVFLLSRALADSIVMYTPAVVLSALLGFDERIMIVLTGVSCIIYTVLGGMRAVMWTEVFQMILIFIGVIGCLVAVTASLPSGVSFAQALQLAGAARKLEVVSFSLDPSRYTIWTGLFGGLFLMLSYFGCDQSQVQRYLTARSVGEARRSLLFNAFAKLPMQFLIFGTGALLYVFFVFEQPPVNFDRAAVASTHASARGAELDLAEQQFRAAHDARRSAARRLIATDDPTALAEFRHADAEVQSKRQSAQAIIDAVALAPRDDVNYVFPFFVIRYLPMGLLGLLLVAILAAAMSTVESELNSLSTATIVDFYRRLRPDRTERHYVVASKLSTAAWGMFATVMAMNLGHLGSAIETVNRIGSFFYGPILGVFVLALRARRVHDGAAALGLLGGIGAVVLTATQQRVAISFLYYNLIGCATTVLVALAISAVWRLRPRPA